MHVRFVLVVPSGRIPEMIVVRAEADQPETVVAEIGWISENDSLSDFSGVIKAIAAGRRSAASNHQSLYGFPMSSVRPDLLQAHRRRF